LAANISTMARPPRIPVWLQWDQRVIYFITLCVAHRKHYIRENPVRAGFVTRWENWPYLIGYNESWKKAAA
jgi:hypothetical protein